ncbi:sulfite oxidase-like oxidoreductase [Nocardia huaxiensis]|uniref:Sulfite oxidase-like oxidoreductase n=1 Tax=Nocardia huaxiensis TaxID=2755382 RepID=A0A7D6Z799_9NOCA|nr:sulfite oxidase-like oxidoreductase [Nocardia huaxiensis]QLY33464.1 sulfite oxidase-like oxidoreductase [Nocardia huaxiensis]UFS99625.1 sulfite oxidase-like oxidoreductase [Nocardia huaxiensis]
MSSFSPGFQGRPRQTGDRVPPGQYLVDDFPVLSAGPTPHIGIDRWQFSITNETGRQYSWSWPQFMSLPQQRPHTDIHCVTRWSKLDTDWQGVSLDTLLENIETQAEYASVSSYGGYTTNLPLDELVDGKAWLVHTFDGEDLSPEHGGPVRLLVPHLYLWKSAKWVKGIRLLDQDEPGFWESGGYHSLGDPWREQRYQGD